ncbi:MAG: histone deacetylase [Acidobacteriota bacterium]|nr:histone deacetylase [Acidobacteriota bacterium]
MKAFYCDHFVLPLPPQHRFPMAKYRLLRERVGARGVVAAEHLRVPPAASDEELLRVHDPEYLRRVVRGELTREQVRRMGFPWSPALVERSRRSVGGTLAAGRWALAEGVAANLAGGTHHAFTDRGEGFCVFNDAAVTARAMQAEGRVERVAILDCDVHQGNGTASIFAGDASVLTISIHGERNYPFHKEHSDVDLALPDGTGDGDYLEILDHALDRSLAPFDPQLVIYLAGADPYHGDRLGRLALSRQGLRERDRRVLSFCADLGIPIALVMAGGYARPVERIVDIHTATLELAAQSAVKRQLGTETSFR